VAHRQDHLLDAADHHQARPQTGVVHLQDHVQDLSRQLRPQPQPQRRLQHHRHHQNQRQQMRSLRNWANNCTLQEDTMDQVRSFRLVRLIFL
jgi:hypothetical protein